MRADTKVRPYKNSLTPALFQREREPRRKAADWIKFG